MKKHIKEDTNENIVVAKKISNSYTVKAELLTPNKHVQGFNSVVEEIKYFMN